MIRWKMYQTLRWTTYGEFEYAPKPIREIQVNLEKEEKFPFCPVEGMRIDGAGDIKPEYLIVSRETDDPWSCMWNPKTSEWQVPLETFTYSGTDFEQFVSVVRSFLNSGWNISDDSVFDLLELCHENISTRISDSA